MGEIYCLGVGTWDKHCLKQQVNHPKMNTSVPGHRVTVVNLTVKPAPPTVVEQPKDHQTFILNIIVYTNTTKLFSNVLAMPFKAFKYHKFVA